MPGPRFGDGAVRGIRRPTVRSSFEVDTIRRILFIESGSEGGGSFDNLYQYLRAMDRDRFSPVVAYLNPNRYEARVEELGIPVHVCSDLLYSKSFPGWVSEALWTGSAICRRYVPKAFLPYLRAVHAPLVRELRTIVQDFDVDLIHANNQVRRDLFAPFLSESVDRPCVSHILSMTLDRFHPRLAAYTNETVSQYLAISNAVKNHWADLGVDEEKISVVHTGIPIVDPEPTDLRADLGLDPEASHLVGCVANFMEVKDHAFLLRAVERLVKREPDVHLLLAGKGPLEEDVRREVEARGLEENVVFVGFVDDPLSFMAGLDLLVLSSRMEAFPRVILEAMVAQTPVVATAVGGVPELVEDGKSGVLAEHGDPEGFAEAMDAVLSDPTLAEAISTAGRRRVEQRFGIDAYARRVEEAYGRVLDAPTHERH